MIIEFYLRKITTFPSQVIFFFSSSDFPEMAGRLIGIFDGEKSEKLKINKNCRQRVASGRTFKNGDVQFCSRGLQHPIQ